MAHYYTTKNPFYKTLPKFRADCLGNDPVSIDFIYPKANDAIFLPKDFDGKTNDLIVKVAHSKPETTVFWYIDNTYIGSTKDIHEIGISPLPGSYLLTATDSYGNEAKRRFTLSR
jgi:penicillin-binding protein 1C